MLGMGNTIAIFVGICAMSACTTVSTEPSPQLVIEDMPLEGVIIVRNTSATELSIYYIYREDYGDLQMFLVRFRDRDGQLVPIDGAAGGWFTPKIYVSDLYVPGSVPRREFRIPAHGAIEFERRLTDIAYQVRRNGPAVEGPCEIQIRLVGYRDNDMNRPIDATADWKPGPCPR